MTMMPRKHWLPSACVLLFIGCGGSSGGGGGPSQPDYHLSLDTNPPAAGQANSARLYLGQLIVDNGQNYAFWGTKNSDGSIDRISESLTWMNLPLFGIRTIYDPTTGLPVLVYSEDDNSAITIQWESDRAIFSGFDDNGDFIAAVEVTRDGTGFRAETLSQQPTMAQAYRGSFTGDDDGVIVLTISGTAAAPALAGSSFALGAQTVADDADDGSLFGFLSNLDDINPVDSIREFGKDLLRANADGVITVGQGLLALSVIPVIVGTGGIITGLAVAGGTAIVAGMVTKIIVSDAAADLADRIDNFFDSGGSTDDPGFDEIEQDLSYDDESSLAQDVEPDDPASQPDNLQGGSGSDVQGTAVFGSDREVVSLTGSVDANDQVSLTGTTSGGEAVSFTGQVDHNTGTITGGTWSRGPASSGSWDGAEGDFSDCEGLQNSGGTGVFTDVVELGTNSGSFDFTYEAYSIPDQFQIYHDNQEIFTTGGLISGGTTETVNFSGSDTFIFVVVTGNQNAGTAWDYTVGCP